MRRSTPAMLCVGETLLHLIARLGVFLCLLLTCTQAARASSAAALPAVVADVQSFRGRIAYSGHRISDRAQAVQGTLTASGNSWTLEERSPQSLLHIGSDGSWIRVGPQTYVFDDPFELDALVNSWAALLGSSSGQTITPTSTTSAWSLGPRVRVYLNAAQNEVMGAADTASTDDISFAYSDWLVIDGLRLPQTILKMRGGVAVASFLIDSYQVELTPGGAPAALSAAVNRGVAPPALTHGSAVIRADASSAWQPYVALFSLFFLGLGFVAWTRRDALFDRLCRRLAVDPRGWHQQGTNVFVSPEGTMFFEGRPYHVGAAFYNQATTVQSSALFIRVSASQVPSVLIMARKFPLPNASRKTRAATGFTFVEALVSAALFAVVIVAAVFPALIALAQADRVAAQHETANEIAANALADEEAALAYGGAIQDTSATSVVGGMTLTVTLTPAGISGLHNVVVQVADSSGRTLSQIATMIGPPVPAPGASAPPGYP